MIREGNEIVVVNDFTGSFALHSTAVNFFWHRVIFINSTQLNSTGYTDAGAKQLKVRISQSQTEVILTQRSGAVF